MNIGIKKHLFFDKDNTITRSKSLIDSDIYTLLNDLPHDVIIVSGQMSENIRVETNNLHAIVLGQNGNHAIDVEDKELWNNRLSSSESGEILEHIGKLMRCVDIDVKDPNNLVEHRGAQLCYSIIGHDEEVAIKEKYDPNMEKREEMLKRFPFESETVEVKIGGTTTFDYFAKGKHKGFNVKRLIDHMGWNNDECIYFGDMLVPGGNDESVIGVIETVAIDNHRHTYDILRGEFN